MVSRPSFLALQLAVPVAFADQVWPPSASAYAVTLDGRPLAVCAEQAVRMVHVDLTQQRVVGTTCIEGAPLEACLFPADGRRLLTTRRGEAGVELVDLRTGRLRKGIATGGQPNAMALIGGRLKHAIAQSQRLIGSRCSILPGGVPSAVSLLVKRPIALAATRDSKRIYVACRKSGSVTVIDATKQRVVSNTPASAAPTQLALTEDGRRFLAWGAVAVPSS
jgi:YVTN family beta-propeller protein